MIGYVTNVIRRLIMVKVFKILTKGFYIDFEFIHGYYKVIYNTGSFGWYKGIGFWKESI